MKAEADRLTWQSKCLPARLAVNAQAAAVIGVIEAASQISEFGDIPRARFKSLVTSAASTDN
jgi:hypothetical protein